MHLASSLDAAGGGRSSGEHSRAPELPLGAVSSCSVTGADPGLWDSVGPCSRDLAHYLPVTQCPLLRDIF